MVLAVEYQAETLEVTDALSRKVLRIARTADPDDIDLWWVRALPVVLALVRATAPDIYGVTLNYLDETADQNDTDLDIPLFDLPDLDTLVKSFTSTGPVGFKKSIGRGKSEADALRSMQVQLAGSTTRQALNVGRRLITDTATRNKQVLAWRRVTAANPCYFCALLASRGAVYRSRETALFSGGDRYHDHCRCTAELAFKEEEEPQSVQELYGFYLNATAGTSGQNAIKTFRRAWNTRTGLNGRFGV